MRVNGDVIDLHSPSNGKSIGGLQLTNGNNQIYCNSCEAEGMPTQWQMVPKYDDEMFEEIWNSSH